MNYYKIKLAGLAVGIATVVVPPVLYKVSEVYIGAYQSGSTYLGEVRSAVLRTAGLTKIQPEPEIDALIIEAAAEYKLNPKLLAALIKRESENNSDAFSPKGAIGLAQIMPFNSTRCGLKKRSKLWDDRNNIRCGAQILSEELTTYKGDLYSALLVYNGGPLGLKKKYPESVKYAEAVIFHFAQAISREVMG